MLKSDKWIIKQAKENKMIAPFSENSIKRVGPIGIVSYGLSSYGYDITASSEFRIFTHTDSPTVDPKKFDPEALEYADCHNDGDGVFILIPPHSFCLARTVEYIKMPRNATGLMTNKSTYARCGIVSPSTVLEAEWEGHITIEISNSTPKPARVYANEGIAQVLFFESDEDCHTSYADRKGKYQGQTGVTLPKV